MRDWHYSMKYFIIHTEYEEYFVEYCHSHHCCYISKSCYGYLVVVQCIFPVLSNMIEKFVPSPNLAIIFHNVIIDGNSIHTKLTTTKLSPNHSHLPLPSNTKHAPDMACFFWGGDKYDGFGGANQVICHRYDFQIIWKSQSVHIDIGMFYYSCLAPGVVVGHYLWVQWGSLHLCREKHKVRRGGGEEDYAKLTPMDVHYIWYHPS